MIGVLSESAGQRCPMREFFKAWLKFKNESILKGCEIVSNNVKGRQKGDCWSGKLGGGGAQTGRCYAPLQSGTAMPFCEGLGDRLE